MDETESMDVDSSSMSQQDNKENEPVVSSGKSETPEKPLGPADDTSPSSQNASISSQNTSSTSHNTSTQKQPSAPAPEVPRLMITKMTTENFKSYAGKVSLGPFHKSFSCIIGPNGSGKSNVIDAMLFVFGYRASKIRSKKLSVLIHKSENHKDLTSCSVGVHFQKIIDTGLGDTDYKVVPNSQFSISRTAHKDSSSSYYIDGRKSNFKDVTTRLKECGVDLDHNRFLILQGEVEQIAMMKPKSPTEHEEGMLEYLEDIIGSNTFKEPIDEMSKTVEELNEQRGEKLSRVKATEAEMEQLEKPMKEAQEFLKMENAITKQKHLLYNKYIMDCANIEQKAVEKRNQVEESLKKIQEELDQLVTSNKDKGKDHKKIFKLYQKLSEVAEQRKADFADFEQQDVKCREDLKHTKERQKKLIKSLEKEKAKLEDLRSVPADSEKEIVEMGQKKEECEKQLKVEEEKMSTIMASLKTETQGLQKEKDKKEEELMSMQKSVNDAKSKKALAESELGLAQQKQQQAKTKLAKATSDLKNATSMLAERKLSIVDLEKEIPETEKRLKKSQQELNGLREAEAKASEELRELVNKVEEARSSLKSAKDRGALIEGLMEQKRTGRIPGIFGRLGDLGAIDEKYDVAISTACGALDYIVVDNMDSAEKCVKFLRDNNVGVATFIALDKMKVHERNANSTIKTPENVARLFDLVRAKEDKFKSAFYYALGNTLVANNLDQATRIALQGNTRHRVVTLQGQLIESSGTMSGGGKQVSKGRMGCAIKVDITPGQFSLMEDNLAKKRGATNSLRERLRVLEVEVHAMEKQVGQMKVTIKKHHMDIQAKAEQEVLLKEQIKELESEHTQLVQETDMESLQKNADKFAKEYSTVAEAAAKVEAQVKKLHDKIMEIGNAKMKSQQSKLDKVNMEIDKAIGTITKAKVAIKNTNRTMKRAEDNVTTMEKEKTENAEALEKIETEFKRLEDDATKVLEAFNEAETQMRDMEGQLEESKVALANLQKTETEFKSKMVEKKHELEGFVVKVKENQQKIRHWKKENDKLTLHTIDRENPETLPETYSDEEINAGSTDDVQYEITVQEEQLAKMNPNLAAIAQFKKKEEAYLSRVAEYDELTEKRNQQRRQLEDMRKQRLDMFMKGFSTINEYLKEMYQMITLGGDAELELVDSLDPFSEGIVFSVRPPKKSWKNICNLSGGEKTLSSLSLVFALHQFKPTPLYVMDEIDAALDFKNVSIVGHYIKERTKNAQFVVISLRNNMFELADRLVGIYKTDNCSKTVAINPKKLLALSDKENKENKENQLIK